MGNAFFVVWRESLEAFLIAGILFAWLQANDETGRGKRALFAGLGVGVGLAVLLGWTLLTVQDELTGQALDMFQTATLFVAAGLITQMVLWMRKHGRTMKARLHADLAAAAERSGFLGVAVVAALAVAREGAETVIFLYGLAQGGDMSALAVGTVTGLAAAGLTAWLAARSLARLNIGLLLRLSSILLLVLASALLVSALDRLIGSGHLPPLLDPIWDTSVLLDDTTRGGKLIADFSGYRARPALSELLLWAAYWGGVLFAWRRTSRG
ncbi:FTR1 family protein [Thauera sp. 2A1]|uniref:FTR1 family iron permease n=1 Tax=Thauera sp. 2A1 TaxID=2570191 RepID=UPI0012916E31|nr:FTR1 family protein [Thauera sp. 2A1]KAI5915299.1 FTR1 family protein [Thauera sp. 2A1]MBS0555726.1 FTR1 family protein [Pseudomonadota bacterium]